MEQKKNRLHYAWFILAGCCILQGATLGLINNCAGVFYSPICKELGFELGKLTMYRMLYCISSALALPFVATSFRKHDVRIVISIAAVIYGGCAALMGTFHELRQWHLTGIIQGIASSFVCMIPAPIILGNWFKKKTGMTYQNYLISYRIDRAKKLLAETDLRIYEVCKLVGYNDVNHFNQVFERSESMKPSEFRQRYKQEEDKTYEF